MDSRKEFIRINELQRLEREGYPEAKVGDKRPEGAEVEQPHRYDDIGNIQLKCDKPIWRKLKCPRCGETIEVM